MRLSSIVCLLACAFGASASIYLGTTSGPDPAEFRLQDSAMVSQQVEENNDELQDSNEKVRGLTAKIKSRRFQNPLVVQTTKAAGDKKIVRPQLAILDLYYAGTTKLATIKIGNNKIETVSEGQKIGSLNATVKSIKPTSVTIAVSNGQTYTYQMPGSKKQ